MNLLGVFYFSLLVVASSGRESQEERLIGWQGETYKPKDRMTTETDPEEGPSDPDKPWIQVLSWKPRAFVYHNFLTTAEVTHILKLAAPQMKRSTVVGPNNTGVVDDIRTSAGTFLNRNQDDVIKAIEHRLALWSNLPESHQEDMQVLRYGVTNKYGPHIDGLERVMSVLIYLVAPDEGGETAFPMSNGWLHPEMGEQTQGPFSACAKGHVAYKPRRGDALMFYDTMPDYRMTDQNSMHTGCPVVKGVKWNAVKWIHGKPFREEEFRRSLKVKHEPLPDPGLCADLHDQCQHWASVGECEKNPGYMTGSNSGQGMCRKSCKACTVCKPKDRACLEENRRRGNYINFDPLEFKGLDII
mmetsp:Transcript_26898/g.58722  ORF Transcript_26898/g.58722 Transcript_26898/m.58722 type:complete len:357 (-) Transcript_26898:792-1862(-)|eukprot:CAMPEP_0202891066 /NCGR_PEP_ID=MMETSP1392-20130828/1249_1 /ASSEMBLY_ACC=CAM_ASM_000868 /TAXON_ID=225041 /ORGANISM="Chlamydomonas chlamydogama, Strain SAG 11-48b" /LENGTH=356 /DNA_ID=CAMNT_0049574737 /DNA_START=140 /DNA_END=1210 /DNA_ORIENTATION=-